MRVARRPAVPRPVRRLRGRRSRGLVPRGRGGDAGRAGPAYGRAHRPQRRDPRLPPGAACGPGRDRAAQPPAAPYDLVFVDPPYPMPPRTSTPCCVAARRPRLAGPGPWWSSSGGRAAPSRLARRARRGARRVRRDRALVRSPAPRDPARDRSEESRAPCRVPRLVRPGDQRPPRHRRARRQALRRGRRRRRRQHVQEPALHRRRAHRHAQEACAGWPTSGSPASTGLLIDFCRQNDAARSSRACAAVTDFDYELPDGPDELHLAGVETVFVPAPSERLPRLQAGQGGRDLRRRRPGLVPDFVLARLVQRWPSASRRGRADPRGRIVLPRRHPAATIPRFCLCPDTGSDVMTSLDPRAPLVLDTRELGRRPGSQRKS